MLSKKFQRALEDTVGPRTNVTDSEEDTAKVRLVNEMSMKEVHVVTLEDEDKSKVAPQTDFTALDLLSYTWQISSGMVRIKLFGANVVCSLDDCLMIVF